MGTTGLNPTDVVIDPGVTILALGALLDTPPCNGAPNPAICDDKKIGNTIVAGQNGIAETLAMNQPTSYALRISSGWRNPRRNLAVNGAASSKHLLGDAIDLQPVTVPSGKTKGETWCILQTAAKQVAPVGIAERLSLQVPCDDPSVTHVHAQR